MNKVLVVYASRMGSTGEIAMEIGAQLTRRGIEVDVKPVGHAQDARDYAAVILGSPVYLRRWDAEAVRYLQQQSPDLSERPTWLFQSGPCGPDEETKPDYTPRRVAKLCSQIGIDRPITFGGNLDPARAKGIFARVVAGGDLAGDFRDWDQIRSWADGIADRLVATSKEAAR
jgi:menaquinone-dependent protoporphyrinogen oxidase